MLGPKRKTIAIVSAHEGGATWVRMVRHIAATTSYAIESFHEYDDDYYRSARSRPQRLALRVRTFIVFPLRFILRARSLAHRSELMIVVTSPFFMPVIAAALVPAGRQKIVVLMNDIYPEALVAKNIISRDGRVERWMKALFAAAFRAAARVIFISQHHRDFVLGTVSSPPAARVIPVSANSDPFSEHPPAPSSPPVHVLYCGTLGAMHETATFLGWLAQNRVDVGVRFSFCTSGASKHRFERDVRATVDQTNPVTPVALANALSEEHWVQVMRSAQVGLVFQDVGSAKVIFPSKLAGILAAGQAVLAVAERDSEIAQLILNNDCGWVVEPGDVAGFDCALRELAHPEALLARRRNAFCTGQSRFGKAAIANQWTRLFDELLGAPTQEGFAGRSVSHG